MSGRDFVRQLPREGHSLKKPTWFFEKLHLDWPLLLLLMALGAMGLTVLYSASGEDIDMVYRQLLRFGLGFGVMLLVSQISPHHYQRWSPWLYGLGVILLIAVLVMGVGAKGAQRWLSIPGFPRFQPSELLKVALPMMISAYYADRHLPPRFKHIFWGMVMMVLPTGLIAKQPDLGTAILIAVSGAFVILLAGISARLIFAAAGVLIACIPLYWMLVMQDYQKQRVMTFLDPESDPLGSGWNIIQSKTAIGSGGLDGKGWMAGTQSHLNFLPESHTDFIIAVFAEEFGFIGMLILLGLYMLIVSRCLLIALSADDTFGRLLAGSLTFTFFFYFFVNIGMVSGVLPVVGLPLPLMSYGGTSLVTLFVGFGLLMSIQTHKKLLRR